jgi:ATP/maltotriose-dependent transcriptional regulator MalT
VGARYCYEQCIELASDVQSQQRLTIALRTLAYTERLRGDLTTALATVRKSIDLASTHAQPEHQVLGMALQAAILHDLGEVGQARIEFARLAVRNQLGNGRRGLWYAEHLLATDRYSEARELLQDNVAGCERRGWAGHAAHGRVLLGLALLHLEPGAAPHMLGAARTWARSSGEVEMQLRVHDLACRVALSRGAFTEAAAEVLAGERLVTASGAGLFRSRFAALRSAVQVAHSDAEARTQN